MGNLGPDHIKTPSAIRYVSSDPDGVLTAPRGTLAIDTTTNAVYQNTDGATAWKGMVQTAPRFASGRYFGMPNVGASVGTNNLLGNGSFRCTPAYVPNRITITRMMAGITGAGDAGCKLRLGIYADDGSGRPGSLVLDAGTINGDSATDQEITGLSTAIGPGVYWFGAVVQLVTATQPTVRTINNISWTTINVDLGTTAPASSATGFGGIMTGVTGALPSTFTWSSFGSTAPRIFIKT